MTSPPYLPTSRRAYRRQSEPGKLALVTEDITNPIPATTVLIEVHAVSLNYRDGNILNGTNPWPVLSNGVLCSDAAGVVIATGSSVRSLKIGDRVTPILDQASITGREQERCWLAADVDGVLADYLVMDESFVCKIPDYLSFDEASCLVCAGLTAWSALAGISMGSTVLIQGTGGVSMMTVKLARAAGCRVILSSSSDEKLRAISERYSNPPIITINYKTDQQWDQTLLRLTANKGVELVIENGGTSSLVKSLKCTTRGGVVSQVGYLGKQDPIDLQDLVPLLIDRKVNLRGINVGSKHGLEDLYAAVDATKMRFEDIIDSRFPFEKAEEAVRYVWEGKQTGKVVIQVDHTKSGAADR